jgi:drug/metabolite transporter (DMT)-like permease
MNINTPGPIHATTGYIAALLSAASWAFSSIILRKVSDHVPALGLNFGKCIAGVLVLAAALFFIHQRSVPQREFFLLGISGLLGIAIGDTLFFKALVTLGPRLVMLFGALCPVCTVMLAFIFLRERPSALAWAGILVTLSGVNWVLLQNIPVEHTERKARTAGIKYALVSVLCNSTAVILAKIGVSTVSALQGTFIRFLWAMAGLAVIGLMTRQYKLWLRPFGNTRVFFLALGGILVAVLGGFFLFLLSLKYIDVSVASILNETSPLFILPVSWLFLKERTSLASVIGTVVSVIGVTMIILG